MGKRGEGDQLIKMKSDMISSRGGATRQQPFGKKEREWSKDRGGKRGRKKKKPIPSGGKRMPGGDSSRNPSICNNRKAGQTERGTFRKLEDDELFKGVPSIGGRKLSPQSTATV